MIKRIIILSNITNLHILVNIQNELVSKSIIKYTRFSSNMQPLSQDVQDLKAQGYNWPQQNGMLETLKL